MVNKKTFCVAPWLSIHVDQHKKVSPCCLSKKFDFEFENTKKYWQSEELKDLRKDLSTGVKNSRCERCWIVEDGGGQSLRQIYNQSITPMATVPLKQQIQNPKLENVQSFDLVLGNLCNLKCMMCTPELSSQLYAEMDLNQSLAPYHETENLRSQKFYNWPKERNFVEWCEQNLENSVHLKLTGGEPFIVPWVPDVLEGIPDKQKKRCALNITTNLTIMNKNLLDLFTKFKEVWLSVSCEGIEETFEYIRYGHRWNTFDSNLKQILEYNTKVSINYVIQAPSFLSIPKMVKYFDDLKLGIHGIPLSWPPHFHISVLSEKTKQNLIDHFKGYDGFNKKFVDFLVNYVGTSIPHDKPLAKKCISHLSAFDKVRKTNFQNIISVEHLQ